MTLERVFNWLGGLLTLATVTVVLTSPNTKAVIQESGKFFTGSIKAAMGR